MIDKIIYLMLLVAFLSPIVLLTWNGYMSAKESEWQEAYEFRRAMEERDD